MPAETTIVLDEAGVPVLMHSGELQFVIRKGAGHPLVQQGKASPIVGQAAPTGAISGNPNHELSTGRFGRGARRGKKKFRTLIGQDLLRRLDIDMIRSRVEAAGADSVAFLPATGGVRVVLLKQGQTLDSFTVADQDHKGVPVLTSKPPAVSEEEWQRRLDAVRDAAREFDDFAAADVAEFLEGRLNRQLSDGELRQLADDIRRQRLDDLVDAIDAILRIRIEGRQRRRRHVSVRTPRGWVRKTFNHLSDDEIDFVLDRLLLRGWEVDDVQKYVIDVRLKTAARNLGATQRLQRRINERPDGPAT